MTNTNKIERKKYRDTLIVYTLLGALGMAAAAWIFKYTDLLAGKASGYEFACRMDMREFLSRYCAELRWALLLFISGFTVFAAPCAIAFALGRGFVCAVGILRLAAAATSDGISTTHFVATACALALIFAVELIMASKAARAGRHLQTVVPSPGILVRDPYIRAYAATFALICALLLACVAAAYLAPLLPF